MVGKLELKQSGEADVFRQAAQEKLDPQAMEERLRQWYQSEAGKAYCQRAGSIDSVLRPGFFRANEVPAGTYNLHIEFKEPLVFDKHGASGTTPGGSAGSKTDVIILRYRGHTDEPLDLGDVALKPVPKH